MFHRRIEIFKKWFKRIAKIAFFFIVVVPCCNCLLWLGVRIHLLEIPIHAKLFYQNASFIDSLSPACGSSEVWDKYTYWWTQDDLEQTRQHYENLLSDFQTSDDGLTMSAQFTNDVSLPIPFLLPPLDDYLVEGGTKLFHEVTLTLYQVDQNELSDKARPGHCSYNKERSLGKFFTNPPAEGTLIVYRYYTWVP